MADSLSRGVAPAADDRAYLYGDALFETLVARDRSVLFAPLHFARLARGMQCLGFALDPAPLHAAVYELAAVAPYSSIRLTVSRGGGPRGYAPPADAACRWFAQATPLTRDPLVPEPPLQVACSGVTLAEQPLLAGMKHANRLEQVLAAREACERGIDDVLLSCGGRLHSSSRANLFVLRGDTLYTAACDRAGIAGTRRQLIVEKLATATGLQVRIEAPDVAAALASDGAFLCNSLMGVRAIGSLDGAALPQSAAIEALQAAYRRAGEACAAG